MNLKSLFALCLGTLFLIMPGYADYSCKKPAGFGNWGEEHAVEYKINDDGTTTVLMSAIPAASHDSSNTPNTLSLHAFAKSVGFFSKHSSISPHAIRVTFPFRYCRSLIEEPLATSCSTFGDNKKVALEFLLRQGKTVEEFHFISIGTIEVTADFDSRIGWITSAYREENKTKKTDVYISLTVRDSDKKRSELEWRYRLRLSGKCTESTEVPTI